jgi:GntR family transcriptional regulator, transcriptional repressor for pyruvate dehydrogenase complex
MTDGSPGFKRIEVAHAYRQVADAIAHRILSGRLKPGDPVGTESELVRQFGVNRSTIREGIRALEESGLIRRESNRRLLVSLPHSGRLRHEINRFFVLHEFTFRELYETSRDLDRSAIIYAIDRATEADIAAIAENVDKTAAALGDATEAAKLDDEFHRLIAASSRNRILQFVREPLNLVIYGRVETILRKVPEAPRRLLAAHRHLFEALQSRDKDKAALWTDRHVRDWSRGFERAGGVLDDPLRYPSPKDWLDI